ncbi:GntR family transcriptional regulator [Comamonas faecalis]|uniref:GntR family transcriptional regulator n=1 Tax=Comamonas faecalis TaxID=1387849 RepID=A0ABP7RGU3_9BURK
MPLATPTTRTPPTRRAADLAYDALEALISTLQLQPGSAVVEADLVALTGLGRTPVREALLRMVSIGLVVQQPRRGLLVSHIDLAEYLDVIATRRALEALIAACSARRATPAQRDALVQRAQDMVNTAESGDLDAYMRADHALDVVNHQACANAPAVKCVIPLIVQCRRFWYAYQSEGDIVRAADAHMALAQGIASGDEARAVAGAHQLMDYLQQYARRVIER